jgi:hypothetical protein
MVNLKALIALLVGVGLGVGLLFVINRPLIQSIEVEQQPQTSILTSSDSDPEPELLAPAVRTLDFYRQLLTGSRLALQLEANNPDAIAEVVFTEVAREPNITTIKGTVANSKGSMVMTVGDKFMHIYLAVDTGIYEFSGKDFRGVVERTKDMRFDNDIAVPQNKSIELNRQPIRRPAVP